MEKCHSMQSHRTVFNRQRMDQICVWARDGLDTARLTADAILTLGETSRRKAGQCVVWREVWAGNTYLGVTVTQVIPEVDEGEEGTPW